MYDQQVSEVGLNEDNPITMSTFDIYITCVPGTVWLPNIIFTCYLVRHMFKYIMTACMYVLDIPNCFLRHLVQFNLHEM